MKVLLLLNVIGLAAAAVNADDELCTPEQVQSIQYELDWNDGPGGSGISDYSLNGFCQCYNADCSAANCFASDHFEDGQYLLCAQIVGGSCGMACYYIDSDECQGVEDECPGLATAPIEGKTDDE